MGQVDHVKVRDFTVIPLMESMEDMGWEKAAQVEHMGLSRGSSSESVVSVSLCPSYMGQTVTCK
jgi:hypothetical protein